MNGFDLEILVAAPNVRLWSCLTDPAAVRVWFGSHMALDARPGGGFREVWQDGGREVVTAGRVLAFDPPSRLVLSWADADWPAETVVTLALHPEGKGTRLRLTHTGWEALEARAEGLAEAHRAGWQVHLRSLADYAGRATALDGALFATPDIGLRPARPEEAEALHALAVRSKSHWGYDAAFMALATPHLVVPDDLFAVGRVAVAELAGHPVGVTTLLAPDSGGVAELAHLFVDPPWLGRGVGRALMGWAVRRASEDGAHLLRVLADPQARGFYEAQGFRYVGEAASDAIPGRVLPLLTRRL